MSKENAIVIQFYANKLKEECSVLKQKGLPFVFTDRVDKVLQFTGKHKTNLVSKSYPYYPATSLFSFAVMADFTEYRPTDNSLVDVTIDTVINEVKIELTPAGYKWLENTNDRDILRVVIEYKERIDDPKEIYANRSERRHPNKQNNEPFYKNIRG